MRNAPQQSSCTPPIPDRVDSYLHEKRSPTVNRFIRAFALAMILLGLTATRARAGLTVAGSDITIVPGSTATMALTITSDSSDTLSALGIQLLITPLDGAPELLQFATAQSDPYGNPNYVFYNESLGADIPIPFWSTPYQTTYSSDTILGGDSDDGAGATRS